ncbi:MAG: 50S ribosomal protein L25 [Candidatus Moranbacteria bacterium GW2011_GWA2_39_41]|nr:MAG: 50S ribosomal protein L25 [Candidatus Moranbacteria bacterium GW2011_GWA2_39_41]
MEKVLLEATARAERGRKVNVGRREGRVPAVVYGHSVESVSLWVNALDLKRLLKKSGESTIIDLKIDGKDDRNVLIHEIQKNGVTGKFTHIDFFQVRMDEEIETEVELVFIGEAPAVKTMGGILVKNIDKVTVKCLPADLPSHIDIDISKIVTFEDHIAIKDLQVSSKVKIELEPETVIALVSAPRTEEDLAALEEKVDADVAKVEGIVKPEAPAEEKKDKK